jgi:hypothetical protein
MNDSISFWDGNSDPKKYYKIEESRIERVLPLFDFNSYYGWHHITSLNPIPTDKTSIYIHVDSYSR